MPARSCCCAVPFVPRLPSRLRDRSATSSTDSPGLGNKEELGHRETLSITEQKARVTSVSCCLPTRNLRCSMAFPYEGTGMRAKLRRIWSRLRESVSPRRDDDFLEELEAHVQAIADEHIRLGAAP